MEKIAIQGVSKVFGPEPKSVLPLIEEGLSKTEILERTRHVVGLRNVSLDVAEGETFVVMGLSGSGKSTLIRHINRLIEPTAGRILVDDQDVLQLSPQRLRELRRHKISMVFQRFGLLPHRTVLDNVAYGLVSARTKRSEARRRAEEQIALVGLAGFEDRYPKQLSGGMQQRVGLARALATSPDILLMDEAFSALDPLIRSDMQGQLKDLQKSLHKTIVFITHDLDEALRIGDHIAILKDGELRQVGTGEEILARPADDYVERFVRDVNRARVIRLESLMEEAAVLDLSSASEESCRAALNGSGALVLTEGGRPSKIVTGDVMERRAGQAPWDKAALPDAVCIDGGTTIEESFPLLADSGGAVVVLSHDHDRIGIVRQTNVLRALADRGSVDAGTMDVDLPAS